MSKKEINYTEMLQEIESNLSKIEQEDIPIEEILKLSRKTATLIKQCKSELASLEKEVDDIISIMNSEETTSEEG